MADRKQEAG